MGFPVQDNLISYFSNNERLFVFVGKEPIGDAATIPWEDIDNHQTGRLLLRCRPTGQISPNIGDQKK
jgi:hypothetical protein